MTLINRDIRWDASNGSSLVGYTQKTSYSELCNYLGEPDYDVDDKVPFQWEFMFKDGKYASIYPYKYNPTDNEQVQFHIGGHQEDGVDPDLIVGRVRKIISDCRAGRNCTVIWSGF